MRTPNNICFVIFFIAALNASARSNKFALSDWLQNHAGIELPSVVEKRYSQKEASVEYRTDIKEAKYSFRFGNLKVVLPNGMSDQEMQSQIKDGLASSLVERFFNNDFEKALSRVQGGP